MVVFVRHLIVTLGLARLQVSFVLYHSSWLGNQMVPTKVTQLGGIQNSQEMCQARFFLAASPLFHGGSAAKKVPGHNPASYASYGANSKARGGTSRSHTSNIVPVSQWYGHPRVLGIPILKPLVICASSVTVALTLTKIAKVIWKGDAHTTRINGLGIRMPKTRGCPYHCNAGAVGRGGLGH